MIPKITKEQAADFARLIQGQALQYFRKLNTKIVFEPDTEIRHAETNMADLNRQIAEYYQFCFLEWAA